MSSTNNESNRTKPVDKELSAYEKKLNELQQAQNQEKVEEKTPVRISKKDTNQVEIEYEDLLLQAEDGYKASNSESDLHLGSYKEKLQLLENAKENLTATKTDINNSLEEVDEYPLPVIQ